MATSGNGTFIPMVSASPPPMDDVAFDFDDDDDEFSNFSSAPIGLDSPPGKWVGTKKGSFEPIRSDPTDPFHPTDDSHPSNNDEDFEAFAAFGSSSSSHDKQNSNDRLVTNNNIRGHSMNGNESNEEDEFADFAAFESDPVGESNKNDGSYLDNGRQSEVSSSVVLNKNNSHENCESHNAHYPQSIEKHDKDVDKASDKVLHSDDSTAGISPHSEMPHTGTKAVYQNEGGMLSDIQSRIPSQSSLDYPEPAHKHNNTMGDHDESEVTRTESDSSAAHLEKPSTGSLSLIKESDRQTFDSGIDSIMTPSDSSPEGKDDCSENVISEEDSNSRSSDNGPNTANDDEWGDFDTFSSTGSHTKHSGGMERAEPTDTVSLVAEDSSINDQESNDFGEFGSVVRTQQQPAISDNTGKEVLSNSESLPKSDSGNITNTLSTPQNKTKVQCDDDDDDFGDFGNAKQESTDSVIPSSEQDDDFDDFGDFSSTKSTSEHEISKQIRNNSDGDWGKASGDKSAAAAAEDFGEFGTFGSNAGSMFGSTEDSKDDDEFGTFSSTGGSGLGQDDTKSSKSDDFGSFGSNRTVPGSLDSTTIQSGTGSVSSKVPPGGRVEWLFKSCFPGSVAAGTSTNQPVQVLRDIVSVKEPVPAKAKADKSSATNGMVWLSLSDMENTMAQKYHWNDSKNSGKLHLSLGIDSRNILPPGRGGRPLFAQELGMLTPSKPGEGSDKIPLGAGGASDVSSAGAEDAGVVSTNSSGTEDTVPKAEFDWSNSGLINPLDANSLNLDFFANERKSSSSRHKSRSVQKVDPELLDLAVSPSDPPLKPALTPSSSSNQSSSSSSSQKKSPTALDEILKHSSSSMVKQKPKRETGLSSEANSVLDSLPDLSYMLAKVLMFPVASSNSSSPSKLPKSDAVQGTGWAESIS